jgi:hypothetical protein
MDSLTKALLEDLLDTKKTVAIYGGGFKPPTKGHFNVAELVLKQFPEIDELKIFVGQGVRDGVTQDESIQIWDIYKNYLSPKVDVEASVAPVKSVLGYAKENPDTKVYWILGARDGDEGDLADIENRTKTLSKYPNLEVKVITTSGGVSGTKTRQAFRDNNKEQFFHMIPDINDTEKEEIWDMVYPIIQEGVTDNIKSKITAFVNAVKQEGKETKEALKLILQAAKGDIELSEAQKEQIGDQLKDVLKTIGLTAIAVLPGGFIVAVLLKVFKQTKLITPSSMMNEVNIYQKALSQTEKEALELVDKNWDKFGGKECNNGFCDIFAKNLSKYLPGSKIMSTENPRNETFGHVWIEYEGKYFDAETPNGVDSWKELPWMKEFYTKNNSYPSDIENLNEVDGINIPQYLYHATYKPLLKKIKEKGLDTSDSKKAWDDSVPGYVYLALDPYVAESYAEESEMVPESWSDNIIILKVDTSKLDKSKLFIDQNVQNNEGDTLEYRGTIPWEALSLQTLNEVGEANLKPYKWKEVDADGYWVYTRFVTDSETQYDVDLKSTNYIDDNLKNLRTIEIEFSAKLKGAASGSAKIVVNKGELYRVMATVADIVKKYIKKSKAQAIIYSPSKKSNEENFGVQRDNLYKTFISKAFPGTKFEKIGNLILATLPDTINELVTDTEVICDNCGWEWPIADGGDDLYICHKCGHDNNPDLEEGTCGYDTDVKTGKKLDTPGGLEEADPKKGTGKKPEGSSRRLYTDEDPKDTVRIKFKTKEDIVDTLNKTSFKAKSHARQSQVINLIHQRVRAAYGKSKDPEVRSRLKRALDYIEKRKEMSKKKTERLRKIKEASDPFGLNELARQFLKEALIETWNPEESFVSLSRYMIDNGMNIKPLPKIKVIKDDEQNASDLLGKTAYYNPVEKSITLYTMDRHPKDVLRSFAHEMIHHEQNLDGRLNNINTTNTNEDGDLPEIEKEAYEKGNMMLRNWEDKIKNV